MTSNIYHKDITNFKELIAKWIDSYKWSETSYCALKTTERISLLYGRILLSTSKTADSFKFESEHVLAGREIIRVSTDTTQRIIENIAKGNINFPDKTLSLLKEERGTYSFYFSPFYPPLVQSGPRLPSITIRGIQKHQLFSNIIDNSLLNWEIQAADTPFYDLDELLANVGLPPLLQMGDRTTLELVAMSPAIISGNSIIENGEASIICQVASDIDIEKIKLGYRIFNQTSQIERSCLSGDSFEWNDEKEFRIGAAKISVSEAPLVQTFLSYDGIVLHQWWISDPQKHLNPRHAIHEVFDEKLELINDFLFKRDDSRNFEVGIAMLLNLLGFSVSHYGHIPKIQKGPDIIAITPSGSIAVVECTIGLLDEKDKLAKLLQRTKLIKKKLETSGYGHMLVQPVIISALSRDEVTAHLEEANKHEVVVICREDIEKLLDQVTLPPNPDRLFQQAVQSINEADQKSLF